VEERDVVKKRPVAWFGLRVLARTSVQVVLSAIFEKFADKREIEGAVPAAIIDEYRDNEEIWIDYVSDLGDGFRATATIAHLLAAKELRLGDGDAARVTPRGSILVMGGDEVYPYATLVDYEERLVGPYRAMLPHTDVPHPMILAIPGNHDWYDGLTAFLRVFGMPSARAHAATEYDTDESGRGASDTWIGGWRTVQRRSYFAAQLPSRWWLWGIDIQLETYIDSAQLEYFIAAAEQLRAGDGVILCCAKPSWLEAGRLEPEVFAVLDFVERTIIRPAGAHLRLTLAGDHHAYVRYETESGEQKVMAGGGGAYLAATHHFPETITLPPDESKASNKSPAQTFTRASTDGTAARDTRYPSSKQSRVQALLFPRILVRNWFGFPLLVGFMYAFLSVVIPDSGWPGWRWAIAGLAVAVLVVVLLLLTHEKGHGYRRLVAIPHAALHLGAVAALTLLARSDDEWLATAGFVGAAGLVIGPLVLGLYFFLADLGFRINTNELFASQRIERYKCFLRMHLGSDGDLTLRVIGVDRMCKKWRPPRPGEFPDQNQPPQQVPMEPVEFRLIDGPLTITREPKQPRSAGYGNHS
jgi:hypothetical protein